jgi:tRNA(Ser,Leu) C12 N-acetylase TAN1
MIRRKYFTGIMLLITFLFSEMNLISQNVQSKPSRQSSVDAFNKGNYEQAYREFNDLLVLYPKDPLYKYYSGVCLVKLNKDPEKAVILLQEAQQAASVVRTIPSDAIYWLGRAQQLSGNYTEAILSYNIFSEQAGKKAVRELGVPEYIQQCNNKKGQIAKQETSSVLAVKKDGPAVNPGRNKPVKEVLPSGYDRILSEALDYQFKADSVYKIAEDIKKNLDKLSYSEKTVLRSKITETENLAASFQKLADQKYKEAQSEMDAISFTKENISARQSVYSADSAEMKKQNVGPLVSSSIIGQKKDTAAMKQNTAQQKETVKSTNNTVRADSVNKPNIKTTVTPPVKKTVEVLSVFEVIQKPVYAKNEKIKINPEIPPGLIYRIQLAVFRNPVAPSYFKGITPVYGFKVSGTDRTNYYAGMFRRLADAKKALVTVRQKGFKDAFIVSLSGGKVVSAERAAVLEKEWVKKPFTTGAKSVSETINDTVPPTLSFRVEVIRSLKPVKDDVMEGIKKISESRGLEIVTLNDGNIVYLIGKFITFESAEEYADLLTRNGYRNAKVVAWLGKKEIPVETAKQLFEKLE